MAWRQVLGSITVMRFTRTIVGLIRSHISHLIRNSSQNYSANNSYTWKSCRCCCSHEEHRERLHLCEHHFIAASLIHELFIGIGAALAWAIHKLIFSRLQIHFLSQSGHMPVPSLVDVSSRRVNDVEATYWSFLHFRLICSNITAFCFTSDSKVSPRSISFLTCR